MLLSWLRDFYCLSSAIPGSSSLPPSTAAALEGLAHFTNVRSFPFLSPLSPLPLSPHVNVRLSESYSSFVNRNKTFRKGGVKWNTELSNVRNPLLVLSCCGDARRSLDRPWHSPAMGQFLLQGCQESSPGLPYSSVFHGHCSLPSLLTQP